MREQHKVNEDGSITRFIEWACKYGPTSGRTWNVVTGCEHECTFTIGGKTTICYAKARANRFKSLYPQGFEHHYFHEGRLEEPLNEKKPCGVFLDSMSDLMGANVPEADIWRVLDICHRADWHTFFLLTKNAPRLEKFEFPTNVWVGVSMPPTSMYGKELTPDQQHAFMQRSWAALENVKGGGVAWASLEPLTRPIERELETFPGQWAVIGAASNGNAIYQPKPEWVRNALQILDTNDVKVFFKGNLAGNPAATPWREEYPPH